MKQTSSIAFGGMLGFLNTMVVAIGTGLYAHDEDAGLLVFMLGIIPGMITGFVLGALARWSVGSRVWTRRAILGAPAIIVLLALTAFFDVGELFGLASIPTLVCVLILERNTRRVDAVPVAMARW